MVLGPGLWLAFMISLVRSQHLQVPPEIPGPKAPCHSMMPGPRTVLGAEIRSTEVGPGLKQAQEGFLPEDAATAEVNGPRATMLDLRLFQMPPSCCSGNGDREATLQSLQDEPWQVFLLLAQEGLPRVPGHLQPSQDPQQRL